jgi:hypothetical protein
MASPTSAPSPLIREPVIGVLEAPDAKHLARSSSCSTNMGRAKAPARDVISSAITTSGSARHAIAIAASYLDVEDGRGLFGILFDQPFVAICRRRWGAASEKANSTPAGFGSIPSPLETRRSLSDSGSTRSFG